MRIFTLFFVISVALSACATPKKINYPVESLPSASEIYPSPNGSLYTTIRHTTQPYSVAVIERESGRLLGSASSSVRLSADGQHMHGQVRVTYSDDLSEIILHEDFSDASPNPRYILFSRKPDGRYEASYFSPPTAHTDQPGEFDFIYPKILKVSKDSITLDYYSGSPREFALSKLLMTSTPRSSEEWPSAEYKRYE